jgi:DNA-binding MarR family transcriptional regulator
MNSSNNITTQPLPAGDRLNGITENILLFFPLFYRNILKLTEKRVRNPINMQMRMMLMLTHSGMMQPSEIGIRMGISKPNVTSLIDKLIQQGYVQRSRDEQDRRVIHIAVTARGRKFVTKRLQLVSNGIKKNLSGLSPEDVNGLFVALDTFKTIISKMDQSG